ncbi:Integrase core domain-containing protein [Streptosporangium subroseum]|uniref:Integrase core domain-containing protein n=1 Tax=Streptosporangium subroseum TaxID=106412 RepID=A0A239AP94_9ACTN|nr:Integrase core domain-containing protein [Streptosporangium subroseum]
MRWRSRTKPAQPCITAELRDVGLWVNHKRVTRVMRVHRIVGLHLRKKVRTTVPGSSHQKVDDLLNRDFTADAPNQRYVGDITYLPACDGRFLYLATVLDLHSRRLAGWSIADHLRIELVTDALRAAVVTWDGDLTGAIFHSDHGPAARSSAHRVTGSRNRHGLQGIADDMIGVVLVLGPASPVDPDRTKTVLPSAAADPLSRSSVNREAVVDHRGRAGPGRPGSPPRPHH